jgi:hypothetical protein
VRLVVARKPPPHELAEAIVRTSRNLDKAKLEYELAIVAALKAGASVRLTSEVAGLSYNTVAAIAKKHGWPDASEKKRRADEREERRKWQATTEQMIKDLGL